jgi:hypothetical protein
MCFSTDLHTSEAELMETRTSGAETYWSTISRGASKSTPSEDVTVTFSPEAAVMRPDSMIFIVGRPFTIWINGHLDTCLPMIDGSGVGTGTTAEASPSSSFHTPEKHKKNEERSMAVDRAMCDCAVAAASMTS